MDLTTLECFQNALTDELDIIAREPYVKTFFFTPALTLIKSQDRIPSHYLHTQTNNPPSDVFPKD